MPRSCLFLLVVSTTLAILRQRTVCWGLSSSSSPSPPAASSTTTTPHLPFSSSSSFVVAQYNVLAGTLGSNTHPWFLHGLPDLSEERRLAITEKFYRRDPTTNKLLKMGWPDHVEGILTREEQRVVEDVDRRCFDWNVRRERLLRTVRELNADMISLVECDHYENFWREGMERLGYGGIYKRRPRRGCSDGCAIFFRTNVFDLEAHRGVELVDRNSNGNSRGETAIINDNNGNNNKEGRQSDNNENNKDNNDDDDDDQPMISRIGETADRVALLALFRHIPTNRRLMFVSTHLARNPEDRGKTKERARQVAQIMYHVTLFAAEQQQDDDDDEAPPVVLAGDLNETNLWHLGTMARIKCGVADMKCHPFIFTSRAAASPAPTSITSCRSMRIDYILLQPSLLDVRESLFEMGQDRDGKEGEECRIIIIPGDQNNEHIPNERHPSDHVPIAFRLSFKDHRSAAEGCAASWVEAVVARRQGTTSTDTTPPAPPPNPGAVLRLEELEAAFGYFDRNGDGICDRAELSSGLERLGYDDGCAEEDVVETVLLLDDDALEEDDVDDDARPSSSLTLDEFRSLYVKSWLQRQSCFLDRVRSVRTMFDLSVDSKNFSSAGRGGCLYTEMDVDGDGIVTVEDVIDHLARVERSEDSLRARIADAFSFFDFDSGKDFAMQELHQCFVDACPFEVGTDILMVAFQDMGKAHHERVELDEFIDWLIGMYFRKDIGWISRVGPIPK